MKHKNVYTLQIFDISDFRNKVATFLLSNMLKIPMWHSHPSITVWDSGDNELSQDKIRFSRKWNLRFCPVEQMPIYNILYQIFHKIHFLTWTGISACTMYFVIFLDSGERELWKGTILYSGKGPFRFSNVLS